jgi:hypothetical protein
VSESDDDELELAQEPWQCGTIYLGQLSIGCDQLIIDPNDIYRCFDCGVPFHKECLKKHFGENLHEEEFVAAARGVVIKGMKDLLATAWFLIARAGGGGKWLRETAEWKAEATQWLQDYGDFMKKVVWELADV